ncbi:hypothetical protein AVEN_194026-1 [Araneus ventricosus]|uniref:Uncharacterized protein n=1 Tax=Araneus ventricosus TaxID=182803 RepID=A0A4Y1ZWW7_ARAVE|nr:hypothetical protein AVEN_194026-1 [Araneus ventricosus]
MYSKLEMSQSVILASDEWIAIRSWRSPNLVGFLTNIKGLTVHVGMCSCAVRRSPPTANELERWNLLFQLEEEDKRSQVLSNSKHPSLHCSVETISTNESRTV